MRNIERLEDVAHELSNVQQMIENLIFIRRHGHQRNEGDGRRILAARIRKLADDLNRPAEGSKAR